MDDARQQRRFRQRDVLQILVEVCARGFGKPADGERSALPQVHPVAVELKDLLLAELLFQFFGNQHLRQLASYGLLRRQEKAARELHRDRRTTLLMPLPRQIDPARLEHADEVHSAVLEESPVFDRQHGIDHHLGDVGVVHHLALRTLFGVEQRRHQLRLQFVCEKVIALAGDPANPPILNDDVRRFRAVVALRPRRDLDPVFHQVKAAEFRLAVLVGIPGTAQHCGDFLGVHFIAVV